MKASFGFFLTVLAPLILGRLLISPFNPFPGFLSAWAGGAVAGFMVFTTFAFLLALKWQITWMTISAALALTALVVFAVRLGIKIERTSTAVASASRRKRYAVLACMGVLVAVLLCSFSQVLFSERDGLAIGFDNNLGDLPLHLHFISSFLFGDNLPPQNPFFSGAPLRYPYLCDFNSALVWFATGSIEGSVEWPGILLGISLLVLLYHWTLRCTQSRLAACLAPFLFFLSGSMGWWQWLVEMRGHPHDFLPHAYSLQPDLFYRWPNVINALLIPQRSLQLAFPLTLLFSGIAVDAAVRKDRKRFLFLVLLVAPLPFFHGHATIVLAMIGAAIFCAYPSWSWVSLIFPLGVVWLPQLLFLAQVLGPKLAGSQGFVHLQPGWEAVGRSKFLFWLRNTGPLMPLCVFGFVIARREARVLGVAGLAIFLLGNIVMFAPWSWDNVKILIFGFLAALPLATLALARIFEWKKPLGLIAGIILVTSLTLSGALDLTRALRPGGENHLLFSKAHLQLADWVRGHIPQRAVFLTAPTYDEPLVLTGRTMFLGYLGHVWSHGLPTGERPAALKKMAEGAPDAAELFEHYGITHVLVGERERREKFNEAFFETSGMFEKLMTIAPFEPSQMIVYRVLKRSSSEGPGR